jgi:hypothetical protein
MSRLPVGLERTPVSIYMQGVVGNFFGDRLSLGCMQERITYEFEKLENLIDSELKAKDNKLREELANEIDRIKKKFIVELFAFAEERHLERYIQFHQQELIRIIDKLMSRQNVNKETTQAIFLSLESLLSFIEKHFSKYFDQDTKAPESYIAMAGSEVIKAANELQELMKGLSVDSNLIELALKPLRRFIEKIPSGQITYRQTMYVKEVQKELYKLLLRGGAIRQLDEEIRAILLYLNYNTMRFFHYFTNYFNTLLKDVDSNAARIEKLSFVLKQINQTQLKPAVGYNRGIRTLKEQVTDWVAEEINYLERMQQLNEKQSAASGVVSENFRLQTDLSVAQLAYLLKLFVEVNIIQNKNVSDLIRFFARSFKAKRLETISFESFRVRYYNTEDSAKKGIRSLLLKLVDHINKGT